VPPKLRFVASYALPYAVYAMVGVGLFLADLLTFVTISRVFGASTVLAFVGWGSLALAYVAATVTLAWYYSRRLAMRLYPRDRGRQRRLAWAGGAPLAACALISAAVWVLGNITDDRMLAAGATPGEPHSAAIFGVLGLLAALLASGVYACTVAITQRRHTTSGP
jgi:hypothetical protein